MQVFFKDPVGVIRVLTWHIGSPKPLEIPDSFFVGGISVSKEEAAVIHDTFENIPRLKMLSATKQIHWFGSWARFIYSNL
jgi:hypothetical protein